MMQHESARARLFPLSLFAGYCRESTVRTYYVTQNTSLLLAVIPKKKIEIISQSLYGLILCLLLLLTTQLASTDSQPLLSLY
jgi:hypothetical protein